MLAGEGKLLARICIAPCNEGWTKQSIFLILFRVYARASDILFPGSKDYSQEKPAVFLSLPTEAALCFLGMAASLLQITP